MKPDPHVWSEIISSAVVPVVIISACGLLCLTFYNRLSVVVARLRTLQRERLAEYKVFLRVEEDGEDERAKGESEQFLNFLEEQTTQVLKRARYIRNCLYSILSAIICLILTSLTIGLSLMFPWLDYIVLGFFVIGLWLVFLGLIFAMAEIRIALHPVRMESGFVQELIRTTVSKKSEEK